MSSILLKNIVVNGVLSNIYIEGTTIRRITPVGIASEEEVKTASGVEVMDCEGRTAVPGFINMHTHAAMTLMRGIEEDVPLTEWLAKIWETESKIDAEYVYWGTKVACLEMIKTGTTTFNDQYWFSPYARKAAVEMGIRPVVSYVTSTTGTMRNARGRRNNASGPMRSHSGLMTEAYSRSASTPSTPQARN